MNEFDIPKGIDYKVATFNKSKTITRRGLDINKIYISLEGKLQVKNEFENGFIYNFAEIKSPAYIGVMETMADEKIYTSTIMTMTKCKIIEMSVKDFKKWVNNDNKITMEVLKFISKNMYMQSINKGEKLAYPSIYLLISYLINNYEDSKLETIQIKKSREEIGNTLGFSIRTINRNLKSLKDEDLITINKKIISINKEQFKKLSIKLNTFV